MAAIGWPTHILRIDELSGSLNPEMSSDERSYYTWKFRQIQDWFLENSGREAQAGAKVIVWPENNLMVYEPDYAVFMGRAKALARREGVYLLMGIACILLGETRPFEPQAVLVDPSGEVLSPTSRIAWSLVGKRAIRDPGMAVCLLLRAHMGAWQQ